ncbi:MAG TPA: hypothetical protein VF814_20570 [Casimicrobiaceae bacterium]
MRVKSHWFQAARERTPQEVASAAAFIVWRVAGNALKRMRAAQFGIEAGAPYFAFLAEFLAFLIAIADRIAYARLSAADRLAFTTALARRTAAILEDNQNDLLGQVADGGYQRRFIALVNERFADYAAFAYGDEGPEFGFLRCLGTCITAVLPEKDRPWTVSQVMEIEAPEAVATLAKAMRDLLCSEARPAARLAAARGD